MAEGYGYLSGGCLCGALRLAIIGQPARTGLCHCTTCRKETGAPFKHFAVYAESAVAVEGVSLHWKSPQGSARYFCPVCGSHVFERLPQSAEIEINAGILDEPNQLSPTYEVWCRRCEHWLPDLNLPRYAEDRGAK
jgi:hypothetical protein